jgi:hypothetical protein
VGRRAILAAAVEVLVNEIDLIDGDTDLEPIDEREPDGDETDAAWIEWHTMRGSQKRGPNIAGDHEDDEDGDPAEDDDPGGGNVTDEPHDAWTEDGV